ncbi:MAG: DUF167 domain-containing protein [Kiritimatiellia bacterium]|nr:DUF167 domain-containing protein [Kiritimatiellia bacterium]
MGIMDVEGGCLLTARIVPRASRSEVVGLEAEFVRIRLQAPPVEGKANRALVDFLSDRLQLPRRAVQLISGEKSRMKRVQIAGLSAQETRARLSI